MLEPRIVQLRRLQVYHLSDELHPLSLSTLDFLGRLLYWNCSEENHQDYWQLNGSSSHGRVPARVIYK